MYNKVVFVAPLLNQIGGIEKTAAEIQSSCVEANINFSLLTLLCSSKSTFSLMRKSTKLFSFSLLLLGKTLTFFVSCYILGGRSHQLKKCLNQSLVISRNPAMTLAMILIKRKFNIDCKIVYLPSHYSYDLYSPIIREAKQSKKIATIIKNQRHVLSEAFFERMILSDSQSEIVTFSYNLLNRLKQNTKYHKNKVFRVIRPGVSDYILKGAKNTQIDKGVINYLYVGRIDPGKNVSKLLELFAKASFEDGILTLIGDGSLLAELQKKFEHNRKIVFLGAKFGNDLASAYRTASYLIIPTFFESYGHVISESLCSGTPVIGFSFPGCRNAVSELIKHGDNGLVILGDSQKDFNDMLLESKNRLSSFNNASTELQYESRVLFSWKNFMEQLLSDK